MPTKTRVALALVLTTIAIAGAACVPPAPSSPPPTAHTPGCDDPNVEAIIRRVFADADPNRAVRVAIHESHCQAGAANPAPCSRAGDHALGVFQICLPMHGDLLAAVCLNGDPFLAECNIEAAHLMVTGPGGSWSPWAGAY